MRVGRSIVRLGGTRAGERLAGPLGTVADLLRNDSGDGSVNGEDRLLDALTPLRPEVVIDAGANSGEYSLAVAARFPRARVFAFEPIPSTHEVLVGATSGEDRIEVVPDALSDHDGSLDMWVDATFPSAMSSASGPPHDGAEVTSVRCVRGDSFLRSRAIAHVDLLKIDTEGHELEVLRGFEEVISAQRIEVIQFEHTRWAVPARRWVADHHDFFGDAGYAVGRVLQRRIDWSPYTIFDEGFRRAHFVAVPVGGRAASLLGAST